MDGTPCIIPTLDEMPSEAVALQSLFPGQQHTGVPFGATQPKLEQLLAESNLPPPPTIPTTVDAGQFLFFHFRKLNLNKTFGIKFNGQSMCGASIHRYSACLEGVDLFEDYERFGCS